MNDISTSTKNHKQCGHVWPFHHQCLREEHKEVELKLNNDLQESSNWCDENRMVINAEKMKIMIVMTQQWKHLDKNDINIFYFKGNKLQVVENVRLLWLQVDNFLTLNAHIQKTHNTIARKLTLLCRIKNTFHVRRRTFYNSYLLPHMDYCSTLLGNANSSERIYKLRRRAARIITDSDYRAQSDPLPERLKYKQLQLVYKAMNYKAGWHQTICVHCSNRSRTFLPEQPGQI